MRSRIRRHLARLKSRLRRYGTALIVSFFLVLRPGVLTIVFAVLFRFFVQTADEQGVVFRVRDTGYGVSKDEVDLVFDRGFRGSAAEKCELEMGGKGLGLYIAKEIVERMNGKIFLESPSGIGGVLPGTSTSVVFGRSVVASSKQE
mmetsp:Transcript_36116/g.144359  ORF Transcript_36116/g.144359 Transcript_36116/m.144359 type:complete len:146 (-) Transcript_36116:114-551(-)